MKHTVLTAVAHNLADSLASGIGLMLGGGHATDIFGEADRAPEGFIEADFLTGVTRGGAPSSALAETIVLYSAALPAFCLKQGVSVSAYRKLTARFSGKYPDNSVLIEVQDARGKLSIDRYVGVPLRRPRVLDALGRPRPLSSA